MNIEKQIRDGAYKLIDDAGKSSEYDTPMAVAQLLLAASAIALHSGMTKDDLCEGFVLALGETYNRSTNYEETQDSQ